MIILSKLADYGVVVATRLAALAPQYANATQLALETHLPAATVAKVLKLLSRAGIVTATRGASGGYRLARTPATTSIAAIVTAIDGDIAMTTCTSKGGPCERLNYCPTRPHWSRINDAVGDALESVTLDQMVLSAKPCFSSFQPAGTALS